MKEYLKQHWFEYVFAFALILVISVVVTIKFGYVYSTNDDVMMRSIVSGNFTGTPDEHLVFISFLLAFLWKLLYVIFPNVSWYDWCMVGLHYLCWFLIIVRVAQTLKEKWSKVIIMLAVTLLLAAVDLKYLVIQQFTILSAQLAAVSILWMLTRKRYDGVEYRLDYFVILTTLLLSFLLRKEPFLLTLPMVGFSMMFNVWKKTDDKRNFLKSINHAAIYIGVFSVVCLLAWTMEKSSYRSEEWTEFARSQDARPIIYDYSGVPPYENYEENYNALGVGYADWTAFYTYNCELADSLNADKMVGVAEISLHSLNSYRAISDNLYERSIYSFCLILFEKEIQPIGLVLLIAYFGTLFLCYKTNDKKMCIATLAVMFFYVAVYIVIIERGRYPERIVYGMFFVQLIFLIALVSNYMTQICNFFRKEKFWLCVTLVFCAVALGFTFIYSLQEVKEEKDSLTQNAEDWKYVNDYFAGHLENRYCLDTYSFVFSTEKLFSESVESDNMIRLGSWMLNSPLQQQRMRNQGVNDLLQQVAEDEHFYIVQAEWKDTAWIDTIWQEKGYDLEPVVVDIMTAPSGRTFEIIQIK